VKNTSYFHLSTAKKTNYTFLHIINCFHIFGMDIVYSSVQMIIFYM